MKQLDYGAGYRYAHDEAEGFAAGERYYPDDIPAPPSFYRPTDRGLEAQIAEKLERLRAANKKVQSG
jgi:putative ATPase